MQSDIYQKARYVEKDSIGGLNDKWIYMHYNAKLNTYGFKDNGSTVINMTFNDVIPNKVTALYTLYLKKGENITKEQFDGNI